MFVGSGPINGSKTAEITAKFRRTIIDAAAIQNIADVKLLRKENLENTNDKNSLKLYNNFEKYDGNQDGQVDTNELRYFARREIGKF